MDKFPQPPVVKVGRERIENRRKAPTFWRAKRSVRNVDFPAEFIQDLMTCNLAFLVIEYPAHHPGVDGEGQRSDITFYQSQAIKLLQPGIASLFFGTND